MLENIKRGTATCVSPFRSVTRAGGRAFAAVGRNSIPNIYNFPLATFVGWYIGRVVFVFLPGILTGWIIADMTNRLGSQILGNLIGGLIVAPTTVPTLVPRVAAIMGFLAFYATVLLTNLIYHAVMRLRGLEARPLPAIPRVETV